MKGLTAGICVEVNLTEKEEVGREGDVIKN